MPRLYGLFFNALALISPKYAAKIAFDTFCRVRKGRLLPGQLEFLQTAEHERFSVCGHVLQTYHWPGSQPTVLLLHGWESNSFRWRQLIAGLRKADYNIIAFDAPGHGLSSGERLHVPLYTDCVHRMIQKFSPNYLVAHSVGGMVAIYSQYKYPDPGVEKIVTIGSPSEYGEIMAQYQQILQLKSGIMKALDEYVHTAFGFRIHEFSTSKFASSLDMKGLLFHDKSDTIAPFHASVKVHAQWKDSVLVATQGLGHSMHQEEVNAKILDFLMS